MASTYTIEKHTREEARESRTGRVRVATVTTWDVVAVAEAALVSEHRTQREAKAALARLAAK